MFSKYLHPVWNFIKRGTSSQVFSSEFGKILNTIFFIEHLRTTASSTDTFCYTRAFIKTMSSCFNSLFYKLLLFWTILKLQIDLWAFKRVLWLLSLSNDTFLWVTDYSVMPNRWFNEPCRELQNILQEYYPCKIFRKMQ